MAALAALGVGAALVVIRGEVDQSVIVLLLAATVSLCGAIGGLRAGVSGAIFAAVAFNFFHTQPYLSLRIHDADDVLTTFALLAVGIIAGFTSSIGKRRRVRADEGHDEVAAIERVARLVAKGADPADVESAVRAELLTLLRLSGCSFERERGDRAELGRGGAIVDPIVTYHDGGFELPERGIDIPVLSAGQVVGYLACTPTPGMTVSLDRRRSAVTMADLLGAALHAPGAVVHHHN
jgi:K+-sensing histidine kinase KdpD